MVLRKIVCLLALGWMSTALPAQRSAVAPAKEPAKAEKSRFDGENGVFIPVWKGNELVSSTVDPERRYTAQRCADCGLHPDLVNLPYYDLLVPVAQAEALEVAYARATAAEERSDSRYRVSMAESGLDWQDEWFPSNVVELGPRTIREGRHMQHVHIYPVQVSARGDRYRVSQRIEYRLVKRQNRQEAAPAFRATATNSVLATGDWWKIAITSEGIYKLDYAFLQSLGIEPSSIDPRSIRIHGNGGGMLDQVAGTFRHDDLAENAIYVEGESDGVFDSDDYVLFYAQGPDSWKYVESLGRYAHAKNLYSDTTFYYLSYGAVNGKRVQIAPDPGAATFNPAYTTKYAFAESDIFNPLQSGRAWLGETFDLDTSKTWSFAAPNLYPGSDIKVTSRLAARSTITSSFLIREGSSTLGSISVPAISTVIYGTYYYRANYSTFTLPASQVSDGSIDLDFVYQKPISTAAGYMDFVEVEYQQVPRMEGGAYWFTATDNTGPGQVFGYSLENATGVSQLWDVTDPVNVQRIGMTMNGSNGEFRVSADSIRKFYAFSISGFKSPAAVRAVENQDLHGLDPADFLIVSHPDFVNAAEDLADFHRSEQGLTVNVVTTDQVFNEFGSGSQDPTAIRDFTKMFYDRGLATNEHPKYLLLFGDGSYDYKVRITGTESNFVPTYQSRKSMRPTESYTSDDYYGFLDDGEGFWGENSSVEGGTYDILWIVEGDTALQTHDLDISIGRIPVATSEEADAIVTKIVNYATSPEGYGSWRNNVLVVADHKDQDGNIHLAQADSYTDDIYLANPSVNIDKIYMDNYTMITTASGVEFPDGKDDLLEYLDKGALLVNYTGHGGELGWSNARILEITDINSMGNGVRTPAYITATCEFGRWDDPARRSGAEQLFLKEEGGAIAMFTTVRVVYSNPNYILNTNFYDYALSRDTANNRWPTMGEIFSKTKNASWLSGINNRNFTLMGDPALPLNYPREKAVITSINGDTIIDGQVDSLSALTLVTIEGEVRDNQDNFLSTFNGDLAATIFDKPSKYITKRAPYEFRWQNKRIFNGTVSVTNGLFKVQFVVPVDISYEDGFGKISLYFDDDMTDGSGAYDELYIGGTDSSSVVDDRGPEMDLFMNDEHFADGGLVSPDADLLARIFDENGLNTVGTGIGHELTAVLDGNETEVIILNDYYQADKNSYQEGTIRYPFTDLAPGEHTLRVKVWDVANNSTEGEISFLVSDDASMALGHVVNYPNPFTTNTKFFVEHNRNGALLDLEVKIFTVSGKLVKTLEDSFFAEGNLHCDLEWDGLDEYGDALGRGVYVYQVLVRDRNSGESVSKFEKLVVLR